MWNLNEPIQPLLNSGILCVAATIIYAGERKKIILALNSPIFKDLISLRERIIILKDLKTRDDC